MPPENTLVLVVVYTVRPIWGDTALLNLSISSKLYADTRQSLYWAARFQMLPSCKLCFVRMQERRQSGVVTIMSSETGVGKTKLLTVYHDLISSRGTAKKESHQTALLGLLQKFATAHEALLELLAPATAAVNHWALALAGSRFVTRALMPAEPVQSVAGVLRHLRESGSDAVGLHKLMCQMLRLLCQRGDASCIQALDSLLVELQAFACTLLEDKLTDKQQLAYVLQHVHDDGQGPWETVTDRAIAACQAYVIEKFSSQSLQHPPYVNSFLAGCNCTGAQAVADAGSNSGGARKVLLMILANLLVGSYSTFKAMQMHAQITTAALHSKLRPFIQLAEACRQEQFTFFVDELNTSSIMGEMKSLFVDGVFEGKKVPSNIFWVAAINPARPDTQSPRARERQQELFNSRYIVRPCPASMEEAVWAFGSMSAVQEKDYVTAKLQMVAAEWTDVANFDHDQSRVLMRYISTSQVCSKLHSGNANIQSPACLVHGSNAWACSNCLGNNHSSFSIPPILLPAFCRKQCQATAHLQQYKIACKCCHEPKHKPHADGCFRNTVAQLCLSQSTSGMLAGVHEAKPRPGVCQPKRSAACLQLVGILHTPS